jgi:hypothetical protein
MSLIDEYRSLENNFSNSNADWVQFVVDNMAKIKASSIVMTLDAFHHNTMKYRLEDYLREQYVDPNLAWLVLMLNQLGSDKDFRDLTKLIVPNMEYMNTLKRQYISLSSSFRRARK